MGRLIGPPLTESDQKWISEQKLFFHATAPLNSKHKVNVSPKSANEFRIINETTVGWLDLSGSGSETCAHILENGRLTIMFVALDGPPKIMRMFGKGQLVMPRELLLEENANIVDKFNGYLPGQEHYDPGFRAIVILHIKRVTHSCGYSIPKFDYKSERRTLKDFSTKKGPDGMVAYRKLKNSFSIDGLPSIAQLENREQGTWPSSLEYKDGYVLVPEYSRLQSGKIGKYDCNYSANLGQWILPVEICL